MNTEDKGPVVGVATQGSKWHQVRIGRLGDWADPLRERDDDNDPSGLVAAQVDAVRAAVSLSDWDTAYRIVGKLPVWTPAGLVGRDGIEKKFRSRLAGAYVRNLSGVPDITMEVAKKWLKGPAVKACWPDPSATGLQVVIHIGVWDSEDEYRTQWFDAVRRWAIKAGYAEHIAIADCELSFQMPLSHPQEMMVGHKWATTDIPDTTQDTAIAYEADQ